MYLLFQSHRLDPTLTYWFCNDYPPPLNTQRPQFRHRYTSQQELSHCLLGECINEETDEWVHEGHTVRLQEFSQGWYPQPSSQGSADGWSPSALRGRAHLESEASAVDNVLIVFHGKRTHPSSCLLCGPDCPPGSDHTDVSASVWGLFLPMGHNQRVNLLASVLDRLQSRKGNPSCIFLPRAFWVPAMGLEGCFSSIPVTASCFSWHIKPLDPSLVAQ